MSDARLWWTDRMRQGSEDMGLLSDYPAGTNRDEAEELALQEMLDQCGADPSEAKEIRAGRFSWEEVA